MTQCPAGSYCVSGVTSPSPCLTGDYCVAGSSTRTPCPACYYCTTPTTRAVCPAGSRCPVGSSAPIVCDLRFYCAEASEVQTPCAAGYYCPSPTSQLLCPVAHFCPAMMFVPIRCSRRYYCDHAGMVWPSNSMSYSATATTTHASVTWDPSASQTRTAPSTTLSTTAGLMTRSITNTASRSSSVHRSVSMSASRSPPVPSSTATTSPSAADRSASTTKSQPLTWSLPSLSLSATAATESNVASQSTSMCISGTGPAPTPSQTMTTSATDSLSFSWTSAATLSRSTSTSLSPSNSSTASPSPSASYSASSSTSSSRSVTSAPTVSRSGTVTYDPCNGTIFNASDELVRLVTTRSPDGAVTESAVINGSTAATVNAQDFRRAQTLEVNAYVATALRNFKGTVSMDWFPWPMGENCRLSQLVLYNTSWFKFDVSFDDDSALFRRSEENFRCDVVFSSDIFQCQLLTLNRFNFTLHINVVGVKQLPWYVTLLSQLSAVAVSTVLGGQSLLQQSRTASLMTLASCEYSLVSPPDYMSHPTQIGFGSSPQYYRRGLVLMNTLITIMVPALALLCAAIAETAVAGEITDAVVTRRERVLRRFAAFRGPQCFFVVLSLLLDAVVEAAVSLTAYPWDAEDRWIGFAVLITISALFSCLVYSLVRIARVTALVPLEDAEAQSSVPSKHDGGGSWLERLRKLSEPTVELRLQKSRCDETDLGLTFELLQPLHSEYRVAWFACVEYALTCMVSGVVGIPTNRQGRCEALSIVVLCLYGIFVVVVGVMRPHVTRLGVFVSLSSETFCFLNCVLLFVSLQQADQSIASAMRFVGLASYCVMWLQLVPVFVIVGMWLQRRALPWVKQLAKRLLFLFLCALRRTMLCSHEDGKEMDTPVTVRGGDEGGLLLLPLRDNKKDASSDDLLIDLELMSNADEVQASSLVDEMLAELVVEVEHADDAPSTTTHSEESVRQQEVVSSRHTNNDDDNGDANTSSSSSSSTAHPPDEAIVSSFRTKPRRKKSVLLKFDDDLTSSRNDRRRSMILSFVADSTAN